MAEETTPPDLMDVLDHAIETGDTSGTLDGGAAAADGDATAAPESEEGFEEGAETSPKGETPEGEETPADGDSRERDATGKFVKKPEAETEPAKEPAKKTEPKAADPLNDPIPKDLKPATQERIRSLVSMNRETTQKLETTEQNFNYLVDGVRATGTTPEQYQEVLSFMALFNSNVPAQQEKALELLDDVADRLATLLGKERTVGDPLSKHADLQDAVARGQITAQYAKEIARTRNSQGFRTELTAQDQERQRVQQETERETADARASLTALEKTLQASDPDYEAKKAQLVPILQPIFKAIPPKHWTEKFKEAYKALQLPRAPRAQPVPARQPMRAGGGVGNGSSARAGSNSGGMATEQGSMLDAVNDALANMPR